MAESSGMIEVTVKTLDSQSRSYIVRGELTVTQFKEHIASTVEVPVDTQRLIYQGRVLQGDRPLTEYNIDGKVIHLVESAPPQTNMSNSRNDAMSTGVAEGRSSTGHTATSSQGAQDRNSNNYVLVGSFNLPVNIMDPQQIQMSVQQMMAGVGEVGRNSRVSSGSNGFVDEPIAWDESEQSEPRISLELAGNLLRNTHSLINRLENVSDDSCSQSESELPLDASVPPAPSSFPSAQAEEPHSGGLNHPSPTEFVEILSEVRRVEERLRPFIERTNSILGAATSADYNNNTQEREEDQRVLDLVGDALHLFGNALIVLSDIRCNLAAPPPRQMYELHPVSEYVQRLMLQASLPPLNAGTTVTMTSNGRAAPEGHHQPSMATNQSDQHASDQTPPVQSNGTSRPQGQGGPAGSQVPGQPNATGPGEPAPPPFVNTSGQTTQLLGFFLGGAAGQEGPTSGPTPSITLTLPRPPPSSGQPAPPQQTSTNALNPEVVTGIVQGVLSTMLSSLGAQQGNGESIAQFIPRLSQTSNLFTPGSGDAVGFFGGLLSLLCRTFSMGNVVLLLRGNAQPLSRIQPQLTDFFTEHYLQGREPTASNIDTAAEDLIHGLEDFIAESFATVAVREGVDIVQTNRSFLRQQLTQMASHILHCTDHTFGPCLLLLCTQGLFECLALNLYCLRGEQRALTAVINQRIRRMAAEVNPSLVNWLTSMMSMRLHGILEHNPVTEDQIQHYVMFTQLEESSATTAEEAMDSSGHNEENAASLGHITRSSDDTALVPPSPEVEPWAASIPPEWVPIIRHDMLSQRKIKAQPPLSDAYLHGMPAKRRKMTQCEGPHLSLTDAVSQAARSAGVLLVSAPNSLQGELESLQEDYATQVKSDIKERVREDPSYSAQQYPNTQRAFSIDDES